MCRHARFGFEGHQDRTYGPLKDFRKLVETLPFVLVEDNPKMRSKLTQVSGTSSSLLHSPGRSEYEVEILLPLRAEVAHLVVDSEDDAPLRGVFPESRATLYQIKND